MGARSNIVLDFNKTKEDGSKEEKFSKIYFYSHWGGELQKTLAQALKRGKGRWDDNSYLARIIFSEMIKDNIDGDTGYGISPYQTDNEYPLLFVDMVNNTIKEENKRGTLTYQEFVDKYA